MKRVAVIFIGTGDYINFFHNYYEKCEEYFLPNTEKTYFCFTDAEFGGDIPSNIKVVPIEHKSVKYYLRKIPYSSFGER